MKNHYDLMRGQVPPPCSHPSKVHDWKEVAGPEGNNSGVHIEECERCHITRSFDTSD